MVNNFYVSFSFQQGSYDNPFLFIDHDLFTKLKLFKFCTLNFCNIKYSDKLDTIYVGINGMQNTYFAKLGTRACCLGIVDKNKTNSFRNTLKSFIVTNWDQKNFIEISFYDAHGVILDPSRVSGVLTLQFSNGIN